MMVFVTSSPIIPITVAKVKVPSSHSTFMTCVVSWLTSPMTVTPTYNANFDLYASEMSCRHEFGLLQP